jgi:hypothetical protein
MRLLLRLITIDSRPLLKLLELDLHQEPMRSVTLRRLVQVCLDMADQTVVACSSAWHAPIAPVVLVFLNACIDAQHPDSRQLLDLLLPSHRAAITVCLEDRLLQASDEDRLVVLSCVNRTFATVPSWQSEWLLVAMRSFC